MTTFLIRGVAMVAAALALNPVHAQQHPQNAAIPVLKDIPGVLPWSVLGNVDSYKAKDGRLLPKYPDNVLALDNQPVQLQGFMMPLDPGIKQTHFLLTVSPPSCPYCLPAGPEGVVEIKAGAPVRFSYKAMVLTGRMHVLKSDPAGLYYRLTDALPVAP
jgi:hypothetical protein